MWMSCIDAHTDTYRHAVYGGVRGGENTHVAASTYV